MKKIISILIALAMTAMCVPVMADDAEAEAMRAVLASVKERVVVPEELTEFSGNSSEYGGERIYSFEWSTEDYEKSMSVSCDGEGHITSYHNYDGQSRTEKKLSSFSKDEIIGFAEDFLRKTLPEAFENGNDRLFSDESSFRAGNSLRYSVGFTRKKDGVRVNNSYAKVTVSAQGDKLTVHSMTASYDYDAIFEENGAEAANYIEKYKELFPTELVYIDEYRPEAKVGEASFVPRLIWRIKDGSAGYMDICTGEVITEDSAEMHKEYAAEDSANAEASSGGSLSFRETAELENVRGLLSADDILNKIKALPYVSVDDALKGTTSLYKDRSGKYFYRLSFFGDEDYFNARADAETGEILSISARSEYGGEELTTEQINDAERKITEFLAAAADRLPETEKTDVTANKNRVSMSFVRMANGVKYADNGISVTFDAKNSKIVGFSVSFTDGETTDPKKAITGTAAYEKILERCKISPVYVCSGGKYKKAVILDGGFAELDAVTGEFISDYTEDDLTYADLDGHWAQEAAVKLSEIGVGFSGDEFLPSKTMTQEEFLRIAASAIIGSYYGTASGDKLCEQLIEDGYLKESEKAPDKEITREDAFVIIIRMAGLERVAELSGIYKTDYADAEKLSEGRIGYAAILSGMGVVSGDNALLRPMDTVTRAEAIMMLYKYLLTL